MLLLVIFALLHIRINGLYGQQITWSPGIGCEFIEKALMHWQVNPPWTAGMCCSNSNEFTDPNSSKKYKGDMVYCDAVGNILTLNLGISNQSQYNSIFLQTAAVSATELPSELASLPSLKNLYVSGRNLAGSIPSSFAGLTGLETLDLSKNNLNGALTTLTNLSSLTSLDLSGNPINGDYTPLNGKIFTYINLSGTNIAGQISNVTFTSNSMCTWPSSSTSSAQSNSCVIPGGKLCGSISYCSQSAINEASSMTQVLNAMPTSSQSPVSHAEIESGPSFGISSMVGIMIAIGFICFAGLVVAGSFIIGRHQQRRMHDRCSVLITNSMPRHSSLIHARNSKHRSRFSWKLEDSPKLIIPDNAYFSSTASIISATTPVTPITPVIYDRYAHA
ncbi:hypothetical protein MT418_000463 [Batrachochytrium dendrobatidis]